MFDPQSLEDAARQRHESPAMDARLQAAAALLAFGRFVEATPDQVAGLQDRVAVLDADDRSWLAGVAQEEAAVSLDQLHEALTAIEVAPTLLEAPPILTDHPDDATALQARALDAIEARERLHQVALAADALDAPLALDGLAALDLRLRAVLPSTAAIEPSRSLLRERVPPAARDAHWWLAAVTPDGDEHDDDADHDRLAIGLRAVADWAADRVRFADGEATLSLSRDEALALLSTPEGRALADHLGGALDLVAADPTPEELRDLLRHRAGGHAARAAPRPAAALVLQRVVLEPPLASLREAAASASALCGPDVYLHFDCTHAHLEAGFGVVAYGAEMPGSGPGEPREAWLIIPGAHVEAIDGAADSWTRDDWSGGAILLIADLLTGEAAMTAHVRAVPGGEAEALPLRLRPLVRPGDEGVEVDVPARDLRLTEALRALTFENVVGAVASWEAAAPPGEPVPPDLAGIAKLVERVRSSAEG